MRVFLLLVLLPLVLAAPFEDAEFLTVVGTNSPTSDVVTGANFAANMKIETGASFAGVSDEQLREYFTKEELTERTLVVIDHKHVEIIKGEKTPASHGRVVQLAFSYFSTLGYEVELVLDEQLDPSQIMIEGGRDVEIAEIPDVPVCDGCLVGSTCFGTGESSGSSVCMPNGKLAAKKEAGEPCTDNYECVNSICDAGVCAIQEDATIAQPTSTESAPPAEEEPGFFGKIFRWFAHLFGGG